MEKMKAYNAPSLCLFMSPITFSAIAENVMGAIKMDIPSLYECMTITMHYPLNLLIIRDGRHG